MGCFSKASWRAVLGCGKSISSRFPLRRKSGAHRLEMFGLFFSPCYLFSEGTYVSINDQSSVRRLIMDPLSVRLRHLPISAHSLPPQLASGAHPIGGLLFMYRLYLTSQVWHACCEGAGQCQ